MLRYCIRFYDVINIQNNELFIYKVTFLYIKSTMSGMYVSSYRTIIVSLVPGDQVKNCVEI
jgi:hypothetical protein